MANTKQQTVKDLLSRTYNTIGIKNPLDIKNETKKEQYKTEDPKYSNKSSNELIASTISNNLKSENALKSEVATNKAIQFFNDRSNIRRQFIDGTLTTGSVIQDKIGNNKSELADAIRKQFINEGYKGTDGFGDEMLFQVLYKNNPQAEGIVDYFANNGGDADSYAYYIMHPERFKEEKPDSSVFTDIVGGAYDVATGIPRTIGKLGATGIGAVAKGLGADEKKVDKLVQSYKDYIDSDWSAEGIGADTDSFTYKASKAGGELAMFLAGAGAARGALKGVDVASKIGLGNAPTWVKGLSKWAAESVAEGVSEQALDDMVEQRLSSVGQYGANIGINAFFNGLGEIGGKLLYPNEKMTKVLKNVDPDKADDIVRQTKEWVKEPLAANPLDSKMDDVVTLSKEVADTKSKTGKLLGKIRDVMKYDTSKDIASSVDDINLALNEMDDLGGVNIIKKADGTFGLTDRVIGGGGKELEDLVADMNTLMKKSNNLRGYDQIQRLANKYSGQANGPLSAALKKAADNMSNKVDDILSKYIMDANWNVTKPGTSLAVPGTELAVKGAGSAGDLPPQFISDLKQIYGQGKSNYKLLSEFNETLEALANDGTKGIKKLTNIFGDTGGENYYRFLKSLESLGYDKAGKLADEIVGTVYTMGLYGKDLMEESVKKFYPSIPGLYELGIKSALDVARKNIMGPAQIAAGKTSISNPVWDAIRAVTATQYLGEINE